MSSPSRRLLLTLALALSLPWLIGCGGSRSGSSSSSASSSTATTQLPGAGRPSVTIGDKNYTEQFILGELYRQALIAQGFDVSLNRNIGPTEVTLQALSSGRVDLYPEYLETWNRTVAGVRRPLASQLDAYRAGQRYALARGLELLNPSPFADTEALAVLRGFGRATGLRTLSDLGRVAGALTIGGPPQFQQDPDGLPTLERAYGFAITRYTPLDVGDGYSALDQGKVQAAQVNTTDGQLLDRRYALLGDPRRIFGWGQVVPVVSAQAAVAEGPAFTRTIDRVTSLLTLPVMRRLNAQVDVLHRDPAAVAKTFLQARGLVSASAP